MRVPSIRTRRIASLSAAPVAVLLAGSLVWQGSNAAFTAETHNGGNNWQTGSVLLEDDDTGAAMFAEANLTPGFTGSRCIVVTATSSVPGVVKTYLQSIVTHGLENNIDMTIEKGTGGSYAAGKPCVGFVRDTATVEDPAVVTSTTSIAALFGSHATFATGLLQWTKGAGVESKTFQFTWTFNTTTPLMTEAEVNALQGKDVGATFEWELQNS
jgi:hypothetical protein